VNIAIAKIALDHFAHDLVARYDAITERLQLAFDDVQIRAAHPARPDAQQYLAGCGSGTWEIADLERSGSDTCGSA
jgi:hypothetical protein